MYFCTYSLLPTRGSAAIGTFQMRITNFQINPNTPQTVSKLFQLCANTLPKQFQHILKQFQHNQQIPTRFNFIFSNMSQTISNLVSNMSGQLSQQFKHISRTIVKHVSKHVPNIFSIVANSLKQFQNSLNTYLKQF